MLPFSLMGHPQQALKNKGIVDSGCSRDLTCFFAKASIDESNLWHRRLGHVNFKSMNKLMKGNLVRGLPSIIFENDHTCVACQKRKQHKATWNQTDKNAGPQDTNRNAGTQDNVDAGNEVSNQHYILLPLWFSISFTFKSSDDKAADDKPKDDTSSKTVEEPINKEDQSYRDKLDKLMSQEMEASDAANSLERINGASTSGTFSAGGPSSPHPDAFILANTLLHVDQDDSQIPDLEDTAELRSTDIFNSSYDDNLDIFTSPVQSMGVEANFNNMDSSTVVNPIPIHRVHINHPKDQIPGDLQLAVQTRGMAKKCFRIEPKKVAQALDDESWVEAMQEELL
uniref:Ribonuclease H-like domain-containing protein n=1 Tax=Tanacetum cinerariifolium TaxID=118510 RepID=A0A6L2JNU8_TANCI|nr:ribonuclease H-like domain-containing protein [Tanacetum cinerariifolium]